MSGRPTVILLRLREVGAKVDVALILFVYILHALYLIHPFRTYTSLISRLLLWTHVWKCVRVASQLALKLS
jgi:hypothetical protein